MSKMAPKLMQGCKDARLSTDHNVSWSRARRLSTGGRSIVVWDDPRGVSGGLPAQDPHCPSFTAHAVQLLLLLLLPSTCKSDAHSHNAEMGQTSRC